MKDSCIDGCLCRWIAEFEARSLSLQHFESWYMARIWTIITKYLLMSRISKQYGRCYVGHHIMEKMS